MHRNRNPKFIYRSHRKKRKWYSYSNFLKRNNGISAHFKWWFSIKTIHKWAQTIRFFSSTLTYLNGKQLVFFYEKKCLFFVWPRDSLIDVHRKWRLQATKIREKERKKTVELRSLWLKSCVNGVKKSTDFQFHCMFVFLS